MRLLILALAAACFGGAAFEWYGNRSSFSAYSAGQLDVLDAALPREAAGASAQAMQQRQLLEQERARRVRTPLFGGGGVVLLVAAGLVRGGRRGTPSAEEARLLARVGDPATFAKGQRQKAANLLGISPDSAPAVVEAAYAAKVQEKDPSRLEGLAPDLQRLVRQQLDELKKARALLLEPPPPAP